MADINPGFGRKKSPDERDRSYPMRLMLDPLRERFFPRGIPPGNRHYFSGPVLDQGSTGTCVAHGFTAKVNAAPIMQKMSLSPFDFYRRIVTIDPWPENDYEATVPDAELQQGTSVRAGAQTLVALGYGKNYLWAENTEDIRAWMLAGFGGVVIGIDWTDRMMNTDDDGFINYRGRGIGGHCVYLNGVNDRVRHNGRIVTAFRGMQSWGKEWGQKGRFWISRDDLELAITSEGAEACALVEQKVEGVGR